MVWQSSTNENAAFPWWYRSGTPDRRTCQFADQLQLLIQLLHCVVSNLYSGLSITYLGLLKAFSNIHPFFCFNLSYLQCVWVLDLTWSHRRLLSRKPRVGAGHLPYRLRATPQVWKHILRGLRQRTSTQSLGCECNRVAGVTSVTRERLAK